MDSWPNPSYRRTSEEACEEKTTLVTTRNQGHKIRIRKPSWKQSIKVEIQSSRSCVLCKVDAGTYRRLFKYIHWSLHLRFAFYSGERHSTWKLCRRHLVLSSRHQQMQWIHITSPCNGYQDMQGSLEMKRRTGLQIRPLIFHRRPRLSTTPAQRPPSGNKSTAGEKRDHGPTPSPSKPWIQRIDQMRAMHAVSTPSWKINTLPSDYPWDWTNIRPRLPEMWWPWYREPPACGMSCQRWSPKKNQDMGIPTIALSFILSPNPKRGKFSTTCGGWVGSTHPRPDHDRRRPGNVGVTCSKKKNKHGVTSMLPAIGKVQHIRIGYWSLWGQPRSVTSGDFSWPWN